MKRIAYSLVFGCILACPVHAQPPLARNLEQTAARLKANPAAWPILGFVDPSDTAPEIVQKRALLNNLLAQMKADYAKAPAGRMAHGPESYYTDLSRVLFERGGYSNWHLAQVLDFRVAYSVAERTYRTGVAGPGDRQLLLEISGRAIGISGAKVMSDLIAQEVSKEAADPLRNLPTEQAVNQAELLLPGHPQQFPPSLVTTLLKEKSLLGLFWRLWMHEALVDLPFRALLDAVGKERNWIALGREQRATAILANVDPSNYHALGRKRLEERDIKILQDLVTDESNAFHRLGRE